MARAFLMAWLAALAWAGAAGGASAQQNDYLSAAEVRSALLGRELSGVTEESNVPWRECIDAGGSTVYRFGDAMALIGRLRVTDDGQACFSYENSGFEGEACWFMRRKDERLQFDDAEGFGESFLVLAQPRVSGCGRDAPVA